MFRIVCKFPGDSNSHIVFLNVHTETHELIAPDVWVPCSWLTVSMTLASWTVCPWLYPNSGASNMEQGSSSQRPICWSWFFMKWKMGCIWPDLAVLLFWFCNQEFSFRDSVQGSFWTNSMTQRENENKQEISFSLNMGRMSSTALEL